MFDAIFSRLVFTFLVLITNERLIRVKPEAISEDPHTWRAVTQITLVEALKKRGVELGTAVRISELRKDTRYRHHVLKHFLILTPEYEAKMSQILPEPRRYRFQDLDYLVHFSEKHGKKVRGHTLLWSGDLPRWFKDKEWTDEELRSFTKEYIATVMGRYRGRIPFWDVVNEAFDLSGDWDEDNPWYKVLKEDFLPFAFRVAHEADPGALLFYNDFLAEGISRKSDRLYERIRALKEQGVPIHGIGFECHWFLGFPGREELIRNLRRFSELGLKIHITEVDLPLAFEPTPGKRIRQAVLYRRLLDACLEVPRCEAWITWGADDGHTWTAKRGWLHEPLLFSRNFRPKGVYFALLDAVAAELP